MTRLSFKCRREIGIKWCLGIAKCTRSLKNYGLKLKISIQKEKTRNTVFTVLN